MQILIDENIAYAQEAFSTAGNCTFANGRDFTNALIRDFDALIIRSVTQINRTLLHNTNIKFVGTATIGTDHIDLEYLKEAGIGFAHAPGCNSQSVAEYVFSAISNFVKSRNLEFKNLSIGIIGKGNIGSKVVRMSNAIGMNVMINDPPLQRKTGNNNFVSLSEVLNADIVTLHVPLKIKGKDKTYHLIDEKELNRMKDNAMLINSSRGAVVNNNSLLRNLNAGKNFFTVLDVWENEPAINKPLLKKVNFGTPHIAGYSLEGKVNGTKMIYDAFCNFFKLQPSWQPQLPRVENNEIVLTDTGTLESALFKIFRKVYNIEDDSLSLKKYSGLPENELSKKFDELRKNYPLRRELSNYIIRFPNGNKNLIEKLKNFGAPVKEIN